MVTGRLEFLFHLKLENMDRRETKKSETVSVLKQAKEKKTAPKPPEKNTVYSDQRNLDANYLNRSIEQPSVDLINYELKSKVRSVYSCKASLRCLT